MNLAPILESDFYSPEPSLHEFDSSAGGVTREHYVSVVKILEETFNGLASFRDKYSNHIK